MASETDIDSLIGQAVRRRHIGDSNSETMSNNKDPRGSKETPTIQYCCPTKNQKIDTVNKAMGTTSDKIFGEDWGHFNHGGIKQTLTLFYLNIRSLRCHHNELKVFLSTLTNKPAIIALCETWLTDNDTLELYTLKGYQK